MQQHIRASVETAGDCAEIRKQLREAFLAGEKTFTIHLPLSDFAIPGNLWLSKPVTVKARLAQYSANMPDDLQIQFEPFVHSAFFPTFRGNLTVRAAESDARSILELAGTYEPPLGPIGEAIDGAIGNRIAHRSIENLLKEIAVRCTGKASPAPI